MKNKMKINYSMLEDAKNIYEKLGYKYIEVPWLVHLKIDKITNDYFSYIINNDISKTLIGSGEQGFLQLMHNGELSSGKYQAITPCFRNDEINEWHSEYFMKNELIITDSVNLNSLDNIINDAYNFFRKYLPWVEVIATGPISYDIMFNEIELGSYGIRRDGRFDWIYGTGCAEPRLSKVIDSYNVSLS